MIEMKKIERALISLTDKTGIEGFAKELEVALLEVHVGLHWEFVLGVPRPQYGRSTSAFSQQRVHKGSRIWTVLQATMVNELTLVVPGRTCQQAKPRAQTMSS